VASERGREWPTSKGVAADEEYSGADERGREWQRERGREWRPTRNTAREGWPTSEGVADERGSTRRGVSGAGGGESGAVAVKVGNGGE
jgi:hypothetical protein